MKRCHDSSQKQMSRKSFTLQEQSELCEKWKATNGKNFGVWCRNHAVKDATMRGYLKKDRNNGYANIGAHDAKRQKKSPYFEVEQRLVEFLKLRREQYSPDNLGISYLLLQEKCLQFANFLPEDIRSDFKASPGYISNVLKRNGFGGVNLNCEGGKVNDEEAVANQGNNSEFNELIEKNDAPVERIFESSVTYSI
mmetsp:Transcript_839/g.1413  ORF Transcript_839/g.1413 Transcript_839/m.1413 type:complete len:195 (-) Transcript_839:158-742(-)